MLKAALFLLLFAATHASLLLLYPFSARRFWIAAAIYAPGTLALLYLLFHPRNQWLVPNRSSAACPGRQCVALTFDDGPDPATTPRLLELLREKRVPATFFVIGQSAERHPDLVCRMMAEGHLVENHTWSHPSLFCFLSPARLRAEVERCGETVRRICGYRPRYFRSPVGLRHPLLAPVLSEAGLEYISWSVRTRDTLGPTARVLGERVLTQASAGGIVLLHDRPTAGSQAMLEALPGLIDELRRRGFEFVLVGPAAQAERMETAVAR